MKKKVAAKKAPARPVVAPKGNKINRMNALDKAISQGKTLPSKNKKVPADTDVKMKGMKAKPVISPKAIQKIIEDSKAKAKLEVQKNKSPKTNWVTKIGSK
jgi:type II secretory pathway component PulM